MELHGLIWCLTVLLVVVRAQSADASRRQRLGIHVFWLAALGLAGAAWICAQIRFDLAVLRWQHLVALAATLGIFALSAVAAEGRYRDALRSLLPDAWHVVRGGPFWAAAASLLAINAARPGPPASANSVPTGAAFAPWFAAQPRVEIPQPWAEPGIVTILKFNDYECPPCKMAHVEYGPLFKRLGAAASQVRYLNLDYPLERECNPYVQSDVHPSACEAAAAVRLARASGNGSALEDWLFEHQNALTPERVFAAARNVGKVADLETRYSSLLADIRRDVAVAKQLGVAGTPTIFVNGVRMPFVSTADFEAAVRAELARRPKAGAIGRREQGRP